MRRSVWSSPGAFLGPLLLLGGIALLVHVARPHAGTMFDDDNVGGTIVMGVVGIVGALIGAGMTRSTLRTVVLEGPCPRCGVVAIRSFLEPVPTPCESCIAYLRATGEEPLDAARWLYYKLTAEQYLPAVKPSGKYFRFDMPPMCALCGDPHATHRRKIADGDHFGRDIGPLWSQASHVLPQAGMAPSAGDENSRALSHLSAPVCAKHTEDEDPITDVIKYSSGVLVFRSYRYYLAFCALNGIATRRPSRGTTS